MAVAMDAKQIEAIVNQVMQQLSKGDMPAAPASNDSKGYYEQLGTGGMEPFDMEYLVADNAGRADPSPYARTNRILHRIHHECPQRVDDERAMLITEAFKMYDGEPQIIKCAKALAHILKNVTIHIWPDEVVVGEMACPPRNAPVFPEFSYDWITDEIHNAPWDKRKNDRFQLDESVKQNLLDIADFWKGKTVQDDINSLLTDEEIKGGSVLDGACVHNPNLYYFAGIGHTTPRYQVLFAQGYAGLKKRIVDHMEKLDPTKGIDLKKRQFYTAQLIVLDAATEYFMRFSRLARQMATSEKDVTRSRELVQIADNLEWVSANPPRTFWEAIQLYHLATDIILIEANSHSISYGRMDQILYPFYEKDMKEGRITKQFVSELIENFYIKIYELLKLRDAPTAVLNSEVGMGGTCLVVGGVDEKGFDATNDLTYLGIEAHVHTQTPDPWFAVRWHENAPWEFKVKVVNAIKVGTGQPKIFNDEVIIPNSMALGRTLEESRDYTIVGCVEIETPGRDYSYHDANYFSMSKVFELAYNHGKCIGCSKNCRRYAKCVGAGKTLGPDTGGIDTFKSIDEMKESYEKQMEYWVANMIAFNNAMEIAHGRTKPLPYLSLLIEDCIDKGLDVGEGGAKYNFSGPQGVGPATVADGMCTMQQLIFEEKKITGAQLLDALEKNWNGYEALYTLINSDKVHHYGNDDDYADHWARWATDVYCDNVDKYETTRGGRYTPGVYSVSGNVGIGMAQLATPDGRTAHEPVSSCVGPVHTVVGCHDVKGPTAMANSAAKLDHLRAGNGTLMNVRFTPACVSGKTGRDNFIKYIDSYFMKKGLHCQFNIVNKETLRDAQRHPENYPGLLVRVAGYSAYFVRISKELQDDLIGRNEYSSFD